MMKPKSNRVSTQVKGWMTEPGNISYEEQIAVTTKLKNKDLNTAKIILDLGSRTVYRNSWGDNKTFDDLFEHFYTGYQKYLDPVIEKLGYEMVEKDSTVVTPTEISTLSSEEFDVNR